MIDLNPRQETPMKFALTTLIAIAGALAACTAAAPPPPGPPAVSSSASDSSRIASATAPMTNSCFRTRDISNHRVGDDRTLYIRLANRDVYRLEMAGACLAGASSSDPIVMREPPGVGYACRPIDLDISIARGGLGSGAGRSPCIVQSMTRLAPADAAALPPRLRP
jgi:hypothetical protein